MTQQDRHSSDMNTAHKTPPHEEIGCRVNPTTSASCVLETLVKRGTLPTNDLLDDILQRGGVVSHQQLSAHSSPNGSATTIKTILESDAPKLTPFNLSAQQRPDLPELDALQRDALARALHTPDVFLLQGLPGTGKSRVVTELVGLATQRGDRVLLVAPSAETVHCTLRNVSGHPHVCAERWLGQREKLDELPALDREAIFEERVRAFSETTLPNARQRHQTLQEQRDRRQHDTHLWEQLVQLLERQNASTQSDSTGEERSADASKQLEANQAEYESTRAKLAQRETDLENRKSANQQKCQELEAKVNDTKSAIEQRKTGGLWNSLVSLFQSDPSVELATIETELKAARDEASAFHAEEAQLDRDKREAKEHFERERDRLQEEQTRLETAEREQQQIKLEELTTLFQQDWQKVLDELTEDTVRPESISVEALDRAKMAWQAQCQQDEKLVELAAEWVAGLEEIEPKFGNMLEEMTNVVVAPLSVFTESEDRCSQSFDMVILEEADRVSKADLLALAELGHRLILVGEPERPSRKPGAFQRTWNILHPDLRELPYRWTERFAGLVCTFQDLPPEKARWVVSERVSDRSEIELRFYSSPGGEPELVEVAFPAKTNITDAKEYLFQELEELPIQGTSANFDWSETGECVRLELCSSFEGELRQAKLSPGVTEFVAAQQSNRDGTREHHWFTVAIQFDRNEGWDRDKADDWLDRNLNVELSGRTVMLRVPHRMNSTLANWLSDVLFEGAYADSPAVGNSMVPVSFYAVPSIENRKGRSRSSSRPSSQRGGKRQGNDDGSLASLKGAGLECDLAHKKREDGLPRELRDKLPTEGFINLEEAKAVVAHLEKLVFEKKIEPPSADAKGVDPSDPQIAVMALYEAQVQLVRELIGRSKTLTESSVRIEVGLPSCFRQRECQIAVVSLTRSHTHRAVTFGATPSLLTQALTLARERVILFGDPGTLIRRSHWEGPVDHLEAVEAQRERDLVSRLVHYLLGRGTHSKAFQLQKSCSV